MANIHLVLQGKGGVGKSMISSFLSQCIFDKNGEVLCIDTDPVNSTFSGFKALNVQTVKLLEDDQINSRMIDGLIELIAESESDIVIDNGASTFIPIVHYLVNNDVPALLSEMGHKVVIHSVITGGQALTDTIDGFSEMVSRFSNQVKFIVWLNPYWGEVTLNNKKFTDLSIYKAHIDQISSIVEIPLYHPETYGEDIKEMLKAKITFAQSQECKKYSIMTKQRLKLTRLEIFKRIHTALGTI